MSSQSLQKAKLQKSLKKQRLVELQNGFVSRFNVLKNGNDYNALQDKHAYNYFLHRPVKKHLKRLAKVPFMISSNQAISLEPISTHNQRVMKSLTRVIQSVSHHNLSERSLKPLVQDDSNHKTQQSAPKIEANISEKSRKRINTYSLFDPYTESLKPNAINKIRKNKLESLRRKKCLIKNRSLEKVKNFNKDKEAMPLGPASNVDIHALNGNISVQQHKISKNATKAEDKNQIKHSKLLNFINKKKRELKQSQCSQDQAP